jgi:hypothetical protein
MYSYPTSFSSSRSAQSARAGGRATDERSGGESESAHQEGKQTKNASLVRSGSRLWAEEEVMLTLRVPQAVGGEFMGRQLYQHTSTQAINMS